MQYLFLILLAMNAYSGEAKSAPRIELLLPGPRVAAIPYPTYLKCKITCTPKTECTDQCANKILESESYKATLKRFPKLSENKDFSVCIQENVSRTKAGNSQWPVEAVIINCLHRKPGQSDPWIAAFPSQIRDERGAMVSKNGFKIVLKPEVEDKLSELRDAWGEGLKPSPILTPSKTQNKNLVANPNDCPPNWLAGKADSAGMFECQPSCFYSQDRNWQEYMTVVNNSCVHKCDQQNLKSEKTTSQIFIDGTCQACPKGYHRGPSNECVDASGCTPEQKIGRHGQCIPKTCDSKISEDRDFPLDQTGACSNKKTRCEAILNITKDLKSELETLNDSSGRTRSNTAKEISAIKDLVQFSELHFGDLPSCLRKEERAFSEFMAKSIYLAMVQSRDSLLKNQDCIQKNQTVTSNYNSVQLANGKIVHVNSLKFNFNCNTQIFSSLISHRYKQFVQMISTLDEACTKGRICNCSLMPNALNIEALLTTMPNCRPIKESETSREQNAIHE